MNATFSLADGRQVKQTQSGLAEGSISLAMAPRIQAEERLIRWIGRLFYLAALTGLGIFGTYILLRGAGVTFRNFDQWHDLVSGLPM